MSTSLAKERIYEELRQYHEDKFPEAMANERMSQLLAVFVEMEDKIVTMLLRLVSGKEEFVDLTGELEMFRERINTMPANPTEDVNKNLFVLKIGKLIGILGLAGRADFQLRKFRIKAV